MRIYSIVLIIFALGVGMVCAQQEISPLTATNALQEMIVKMPTAVNPRIRLAMLFATNGNSARALEVLEQAQEVIGRSNTTLLYTTGVVYLRDYKFFEALSNFKSVTTIDSNHFGALCNTGYISLIYLREPESALLFFKRAQMFTTNNAEIYNYIGSAYIEIGTYDEAQSYFSNALTIAPENADYRFNRGMTYYLMHQYDRAREEWNAVLSKNPEYEAAKQAITMLSQEKSKE